MAVYDDEIRMVPAGEVKLSYMFWIKVGDLQFGEGHRPVYRSWVRKTKPEFNEKYLGPIMVNQRRDLSLWCYDGRQRCALIRELFGPDEEILCHVTPHDDPVKAAFKTPQCWTPSEGYTLEHQWEGFMMLAANGADPLDTCSRTKKARERGKELRGQIYSRDIYSLWFCCLQLRRERERLRDLTGGVGPVLCDRLVPGYAIGDDFYLQQEAELSGMR